MRDQPVAPGQTLAGKYWIESVLGMGAMGMVLAATNIGELISYSLPSEP